MNLTAFKTSLSLNPLMRGVILNTEVNPLLPLKRIMDLIIRITPQIIETTERINGKKDGPGYPLATDNGMSLHKNMKKTPSANAVTPAMKSFIF
jgi:hypothetical protein